MKPLQRQRCVEDLCLLHVQCNGRILEGIDTSLCTDAPSAIEQIYAIFANVLDLVRTAKYGTPSTRGRATDELRSYCESNFSVDLPFEDWEIEVHTPSPVNDLI